MLIDEIEVQGSSLSFKCLNLKIDDIKTTFDTIMQKGDIFDIDAGTPGFHDCDCDKGVIRGFYSNLASFNVEFFKDGITTKEEFKRIESCEFLITPERIYLFGKQGPQKLIEMALSAATGEHVERVEFDNHCMELVQGRLTVMKSIVVENPKDKEIRRARLTGHMEDYESYNIVEPNNHEINSISGIIETPLGAMTLTVDKKGKVRLGVKRGLIINLDNLNWILELITSDAGPAPIKTLIEGASENAPF
ncbi:MAG: hypothetical protein II961_06405 [Candidatus Riflebacteria bacterium]|jgi:hypothetical protein|nr:hypothetical protein [Candidatus Riflebacteria bacterium]